MPYFKESSSSNSSEFETQFQPGPLDQGIVSDAAYAGASFPGSSELPLSEQLEPIAVVGMGCRLPGDVHSPADFWKLMIEKKSGQTPKVPSSRFNIDAHFHENNERPGSFGVLGGYFLNETLQEFDPAFFSITPIEAMWMDPQQRKMLEVVYETFESAGVKLDTLSGTDTACFIATFTADFQQMSFKEPSFRHSLSATGVDPGLISNRISHVFNLKGPSIVVNTACSSSVYAIHNACNALRNQECSAAVVGGSNLVLTVDQHMNTAKLGVLSPTSTCHTFNSYANGYGRAEGVGAVYLKRLSDAIKDGNPIRGVIRSSATNNNGKVPAVGITHPSFDGQTAVIKHAYQRGGSLDPRLTGYFETHGTGTAIGDPLEVRAVADSMNTADRVPEDGPLLIGAVKTSIGHSEAASGLSAVIKAILAVERGIVPPTYGVTHLNPKINWEGWQVKVATDPTPFPRHLPVRRVSVNSFGYGGTNAHIIVESANSLLVAPQTYKFAPLGKKTKEKTPRGAFNRNKPFLLPFSAHDKPALKRNIEAHAAVVEKYNLLDLSYTLANHRTHFPIRGFTVTSPARLQQSFQPGLREFVLAEKVKKASSLGFVFTGQGAQWAQMGAGLIAYHPTFLRSIKQLDMVLEELEDAPQWTLEDMLLDNPDISRVNEAEFSQPLCAAIQIALVQLLRSWGITPSVTCGHSSGEIAAAYAAGYLTASEAIVFAYYRELIVRDININGAMLAVGLGAEAVQPYVAKHDDVVIACHNSPSGVTLSGNAPVLEEIQRELAAENIFARTVKTNGKAYHSPHMRSAAQRYEALVRHAKVGLALRMESAPLPFQRAKMVSSVTNTVLPEKADLDVAYWSANLVNPVLFNQVIQTIGTSPEFSHVDMLVEIGPHSALSGPIKQIKAEFKLEKLQYLPTLIRGENCAASMLKLAGELFLRDYPLSLEKVTALEETFPSGKMRPRNGNLIVDLPPYQWDRTKKFWAESRQSREHRAPRFPRHDLLGELMVGGSLAEPTWRNVLRLQDVPWLKDHCLGGEAVFPAAGYFSMAMEAVCQLREMQEGSSHAAPIECFVLRDVSIQQALVVPDSDSGIEILLNLRPSLHGGGTSQNQWWDFNVSSVSEEGFKKNHMAGSVGINTHLERPAAKEVPNFPQRASGKEWNWALRQVGFSYGPAFQDMDDIAFDGTAYAAHATTRVKTRVEGMVGESRHVLHPASLDSCLQLMIVAIWAGRTKAMEFGAVPVQADEVAIWVPTEAQIAKGNATAFSWIDPRGARSFNAHNQLVSWDGQVLMEISSMRCSAYEAAIPQRAEETTKPQPYSRVFWQPIDEDSSVAMASKAESETNGHSSNGTNGGKPHKIGLLYRKAPGPIISQVRSALYDQGYEVQVSCINSSSSSSNPATDASHVIILTDLENPDPLLPTITEDEFVGLQQVLNKVTNLLWITAGGLSEGKSPEHAMASGLLRSLRSERASLNAVAVDFDMKTTSSATIPNIVAQFAAKQAAQDSSLETEYCISKGQVLTSRLLPEDRLNQAYGVDDEAALQDMPWDPSARLAGRAHAGRVVFQILDPDEAASACLSPDEVEVQVAATGLNAEDVAVISGTEFATDFSHEIAGVVVRTGSAVKELAPGNRVFGFSLDKFASFQKVRQQFLRRLQPNESLATMASLPMGLAAALHGLETLAKLEPGESVLILPGCGAVGASAVRATQALGGRPYVAVHSEAEAEVMRSRFGLPRDQVLVWCPDAVARLGCHVVFSSASVDPSVAREAWRHLPPLERFVNYGRKDGFSRSVLDTNPILRGASYLSFDMLELYKNKPSALSRLLDRILNLYRGGLLPDPAPCVSTKNITQLNDCIASFSNTLAADKTVILHESPSPESAGDTVQVVPPRPRLRLRGDATYFLVGCLGGLGRSLTSWMMKKGARHFAFLSRSGADSKQAALLVENLKKAGATVQIFRGDANVKADVEDAVRRIPTDQPIRGVVNAAMVLRDGLFDTMPHQNFVTSTAPKVRGSRNLHDVLASTPLDFFLLTSSVSGILGTPAQSNYAAGNAYMDALALHRRRQGHKATSLILPMVLGVGIVAENRQLEESLKRKGMYGIDEEELLRAFEVAILEQQHENQDPSSGTDHLVIGLDPLLLSKVQTESPTPADTDLFFARDPRFSALLATMSRSLTTSSSAKDAASSSDGILARVRSAASPAEAVQLVRAHFVAKLARMLMRGADEFDDEGSVASYGVDSMIGAELRNWIFRELGLDIAFQQLLAPGLTVGRFAGMVCRNQGVGVVDE